MSTPALVSALAALSCQGRPSTPPPPGGQPPPALDGLPPAVVAACGPYAELPLVLQSCLKSQVPTIAEPDLAMALCARTGALAEDCASAWVSAHLDREGLDRAVLLQVCGPHGDCALQVLDRRPQGGLDAQLQDCQAYVADYLGDCGNHAMQRWWVAEPDPEAVAAALRITTSPANVVGRWAAARVACDGVGSCDGQTGAAEVCRKSLDELRAEPRRCPDRSRGGEVPGNPAPR